MNDSVDQIVRLLGVPLDAVEAEPATAPEWVAVERRLGLTLPDDFKELVATFGTCPWADFLHLLTPFTSNINLLLERRAHASLGAAHEIRRKYPDEIPYALYPETCGLFPWAGTDNGDTLFWQTQGPPDWWPIVILQARGPEAEIHTPGAARLLAAFLRGTLKSRILLEPFAAVVPATLHSWPQ